MTETAEPKMLRITYIRSSIGFSEKHKATVRALGLRKLNQSVVLPESLSLRGMLIKINRLVNIEEVK